MSFFNNGETMFERNSIIQSVVDDHNDKLIIAYLVHGKDIEPGMVVRSYDNVLGPLSEGCFNNGLPFAILSTMSYVEGMVAYVGDSDETHWPIIEIHADKAGQYQTEGSKVDRLHLGIDSKADKPKQYYPPQEYYYIVMHDPNSKDGFYYSDKHVFELDAKTPLRISQNVGCVKGDDEDE